MKWKSNRERDLCKQSRTSNIKEWNVLLLFRCLSHFIADVAVARCSHFQSKRSGSIDDEISRTYNLRSTFIHVTTASTIIVFKCLYKDCHNHWKSSYTTTARPYVLSLSLANLRTHRSLVSNREFCTWLTGKVLCVRKSVCERLWHTNERWKTSILWFEFDLRSIKFMIGISWRFFLFEMIEFILFLVSPFLHLFLSVSFCWEKRKTACSIPAAVAVATNMFSRSAGRIEFTQRIDSKASIGDCDSIVQYYKVVKLLTMFHQELNIFFRYRFCY